MAWTIQESDLALNPGALATVFCVGNGRFCTRGTLAEQRFDAFRGVYFSGSYTRAPLGLMYYMGAPDWLPAFATLDNQPLPCAESMRSLDMRQGLLKRDAVIDSAGLQLHWRETRFASFARRNLAAQRIEVQVRRADKPFDIVLGLDGEIRQARAKYYQPGDFPNCEHAGLRLTEVQSIDAATDRLRVIIASPATRRAAAAIARITQSEGPACEAAPITHDGRALLRFRIHPKAIQSDAPQTFIFDKLVALAVDLEGFEDARADSERAFADIRDTSFEDHLDEHRHALADFWRIADVEIEGDPKAQRDVRFALWSTRISAPDDGGRSSMGAKNLTGDWYRGAVFWDMEAFQLPMLAAVAPHLARNHLLYRCNRLDSARQLARRDGYRGARFPTQSFDTGLEDPPALRGGQRHEIHVSLEAAWACLHYHAITGDSTFLLEHALELICEVADFWSTRVSPGDAGSYHLRDVRGPDQLHMPVDDNAYTNAMVIEVLTRANQAIDHCRKLDTTLVDAMLLRTRITEADRQRWRNVAQKLHMPRLDDLTFEQYAGHRHLPEPSPRAVKEKGEGADKIAKQADAVLIFQMLPWAFSEEQALANYREHAPLCTHTSSLSFCTHALVATRLGLQRDARRYFDWTGGVDLDDSMGNAEHGIHGAGEGGIWLATIAGFGGLTVTPDGIDIQPRLPDHWRRLRYRLLLRRQLLQVNIEPDAFTITHLGDQPVTLNIAGQPLTLEPGQSHRTPNATAWRDQPLDALVFNAALLSADTTDLCERLRSEGIRLAAVVTEPGQHDIASSQVDVIVDDGAVTPIAGNSQAYAVAAQRLRVLPWNCIAITGEADAALAARRAAMLTLAISAPGADADRHLNGIDEITIQNLRDLFAQREPRANPYLETNIAIAAAEAQTRH